MSTNAYLFIGSLSVFGIIGLASYSYYKIFGIRKYKVLKDYEYKNIQIQLIKNPHNNICGICYETLDEHDEICRIVQCDHHFCETCILNQIDENPNQPCPMCMI